jgi:hypothetical protein
MDSAAVLGTIRTMVDAVNASRGAHTGVTLTGERFAVATSSADMITYDGSVTLTTDVTGSKGDAKSTDTISGPVHVVLSSGAWRVRTFTYDGQPLALYPTQARQVVSGVEFDVGAVLSYGLVTTAIVGLGGKSVQPTITLTSTKLTSRGITNGHGTFVSGSGGYGLFVYPRAVGAPTRLDATFANGKSAVAFSLSLTAPPA